MVITKLTELTNGIKNILPKKKLKLDDILSIKDNGEFVTVETNKDILLKVNGNVLSLVSGLNVQIAKEIHLNPNINKGMEKLEINIEQYKIEEQQKLSFKVSKDCKCKDEHNAK